MPNHSSPDRARPFARIRARALAENGQVIVIAALLMVPLVGVMGGLVVDVGNFYKAQRQLQASADAAALAAAGQLPNIAAATAAGQEYSGSAGDKNAAPNLSGVTTTLSTKCISGLPCNPVNAVVVTEQVTVPTFFARVLGIDSANISVKATAVMAGGTPQPANVMIVLDRTASMNNTCLAGGTKLSCAKSAIFAFLNNMQPSVDKVGLAVFPPPTSLANTCSSSQSALSYDDPTHKTTNPNYPYAVVPLSTDYRTSDTGPLNNNSNLVKTVNCVQAPGGHGTSFATAIEQAQAALQAQGNPKAQNVIIFLSDGDANYGPVYYDNPKHSPELSPYRTQPCHQAIASAQAVAATGTWIYSVAYDTDSNNSDPDCYGWTTKDPAQTTTTFTGHEQPLITGISTMQQIASDPTKYFFEPSPGDLTGTFTTIASSLWTPRLIPDSSTSI